jgi:hypothetical protein
MTKKTEGRAKATQSNPGTRFSTLALAGGVLTLTITETADRIFIAFNGPVADDEVPKLQRFLLPFLVRDEHDARSIEISGCMNGVHPRAYKPGSGGRMPNADLAKCRAGHA